MEKKTCFITSDFELADIEHGDIDRYEYTENIDDFLTFVEDYSEKADNKQKATARALASQFEANPSESVEAIKEFMEENDTLADEWRDQVDYESQYQVPMMNTLYYYPSFVSFEEADRYKTSGSITLLYDSERDQWAIGMTGGGMDLSPHLLDSFIRLEKGVPVNIAEAIRLNYNAYVREETHAENCRMLARAFLNNGVRDLSRYKELTGEEVPELERHIKGIAKLQE